MSKDLDRRQFLYGMMVTGGAAMLEKSAAWAQGRTEKAPLPRPRFYWGVGIENCWIAQTDPVKDGKRRLLDVFLQMRHDEKWKADLDLAAEVGVNAIRYSVPWYKAEPKPGVYDWSWIDKPVEYLVNKLKIIPIMDLIHYGTPAWMADGVIDDRFPEAIGKYASALAAHFKGLVNHYSPHNEPGLTCLFCGLTGRWPPYHQKIESWVKIGVRVAKGMTLEAQAIREAIPDVVIVSVDPWFVGSINNFLPASAKDGGAQASEVQPAAAVYPASLAYGKLGPKHPFTDFLTSHGAQAEEIAWFQKHAQLPDILGYNYYPDIFNFAKDGDYTRKGTVPLEQAAHEAAGYVKQGLKTAQAYFKLPVYLTETSAGLKDSAKVAYIQALYDMVQELRRENVPMVGINWWPLFNTIQWDYREKPDNPLVDFIYPGGWNNGLYVIQPQPDGDLKRVKTPAADAYHDVIQRDLGTREGGKKP